MKHVKIPEEAKKLKNSAVNYLFAGMILILSGLIGVIFKFSVRPYSGSVPSAGLYEYANLAAIIGIALIILGIMLTLKSVIKYRKYRKLLPRPPETNEAPDSMVIVRE